MYIEFRDLEVYKLAGEASEIGWKTYRGFDWQT